MRKPLPVFFLAAALAAVPTAAAWLSPTPAMAQSQARSASQETDPGLYLLDLLIVRPVSLIVVVGAVITYPVALLLDPLFANDPVRLKREWLTENFAYTFDRPLGNFDWKSR